MSDKAGEDVAMRNLVGLQGYVRSRLGRTMSLRLIPEVRFELDDSYQQGTNVLGLLERIGREEKGELEREAPMIDLGPAESFGGGEFLDDIEYDDGDNGGDQILDDDDED